MMNQTVKLKYSVSIHGELNLQIKRRNNGKTVIGLQPNKNDIIVSKKSAWLCDNIDVRVRYDNWINRNTDTQYFYIKSSDIDFDGDNVIINCSNGKLLHLLQFAVKTNIRCVDISSRFRRLAHKLGLMKRLGTPLIVDIEIDQ